MKKIIAILLMACLMQSCNNNQNQNSSSEKQEENFTSEQHNGKWTTDFATAQELKGMRNTIENFTLLNNKKKLENLLAYQEFGDLMQMHVDRVTTYSNLDAETKNLLCKEIDKIKGQVETLHGADMVKSKEAVNNINTYLSEIDSSFSYMN